MKFWWNCFDISCSFKGKKMKWRRQEGAHLHRCTPIMILSSTGSSMNDYDIFQITDWIQRCALYMCWSVISNICCYRPQIWRCVKYDRLDRRWFLWLLFCFCIVLTLSISRSHLESVMGVVLSSELELIPIQVTVRVYTLGLGVRVRVQKVLKPRVTSGI